ncbi:MAG: HEAT repeat domain-containing protein [Proteobacteria bacterium]|nr:HEAT repeat domain-containing protein [Pseudomonadota bacterium]
MPNPSSLRIVVSSFALGLLFGVPLARAAPPAQPDPASTLTSEAVVAQSRKILDSALTARNPDTRKLAVEALGLIGPREPYLSRLMTMTGDADVDVRVAAIASLEDLRDPRVLPAIRRAYDDPVPEVSFAAAKALNAMGDQVGRDALITVLAGSDAAASGYATTKGRGLARIFYTPKAALPLLLARTIGMAHVAGLGAGIASLQGLLTDENVPGRAAAALLLGNDRDPRVVPALASALDDKDPRVRAAAVHAIALRDDPRLEHLIVPMLDDRKDDVRIRAAAGCLRLELLGGEGKPIPRTPAHAPAAHHPRTR